MTDEAMTAVEGFLADLDGWESAYPLTAFPEPDLKRAAELLKAGGMTLDAISASNMRHVVSQIAPKARAAIEALTLARQSVGVEEMRDWALEKAAIHHRLAHENEGLRTEHIASSTAYRNLAEELPTILSRITGV
jgi:hypothetical protein